METCTNLVQSIDKIIYLMFYPDQPCESPWYGCFGVSHLRGVLRSKPLLPPSSDAAHAQLSHAVQKPACAPHELAVVAEPAHEAQRSVRVVADLAAARLARLHDAEQTSSLQSSARRSDEMGGSGGAHTPTVRCASSSMQSPQSSSASSSDSRERAPPVPASDASLVRLRTHAVIVPLIQMLHTLCTTLL